MTTEQKKNICEQLLAELESRGVIDTPIKFVDLDELDREQKYWKPRITGTSMIDGISIEYISIGADNETAEVLVHVAEEKPEPEKSEPTTLDELLEQIKAGKEFSDWSNLPTFGGSEPTDTTGIWSWDSTRLMIGTCADDMQLILRNQEQPT